MGCFFILNRTVKLELMHPYCLMPWLHLHITNNGNVNACCVANIPFGDINHSSFSAIWHGEEIEKLRAKFKQGIADNRCAVCRNIEAAGGTSIRMETHQKYGKLFQETTLPIYFDIRFSNVCNFRCRTCWHGASSAWFNEAKQLKRNVGDSAVINNIHNFNRFIEETGDALLQAKEIYFAGGEPLVTEEHYQLLDFLIENKSTDMLLRYNTNFSQLNWNGKNVINYWQQFKNVEILASIDADNVLGEYIRKGFCWQQFLKNREALRQVKHAKFKIAPTVSVLSMERLPNFYRLCVKENIIEPNNWYINILNRPFYYNVKAFPLEKKQKITQKFIDFHQWAIKKDIPQQIIKQFQECVDFMNHDDLSNHWKSFLKETKRLDELRNETFPKVNIGNGIFI